MKKPWMCTCEKKEGNGRELSYPSGDYLECNRCGRPILSSKIKRLTLEMSSQRQPEGVSDASIQF